MSIITSHHIKLDSDNAVKNAISDTIIKDIISYIINTQSKLIVDIERKKADSSLLEQEIISYLDDKNHYNIERKQIIKAVFDYMFGYGILHDYIMDEDISDIDICRYDFIMIKKLGKKEIIPLSFQSEKEFTNFCKLIVVRNGGRINEHDTHARVSDSKYRLRINVSIAPRNTTGSSMIIRKHRLSSYSLSDLMHAQMMDEKVMHMIKNISKLSSRVLIIGKGGSGKTTLLRAMLSEIPITERFLICESESELYPENSNFIVQKVEKSDKKNIDLNDLIKDGLTMSLDGYCIGELIGEEVYDFIKAGYTDHRILGTLHALGPMEALYRIKSMNAMFMNQELDYIAKAVDIIIYLKDFKLISITEIISEGDVVLNDLVVYDYSSKEYHMLNPLKSRLQVEMEMIS